jgi:hypothetical protein
MKKLLHYYEFIPSQNTIIVEGIYKPERLLLITNSTRNIIIFTFNSTTAGLSNISYDYPNERTTIVLDYNCSAMDATDKLQIFVEFDYAIMEPSDTFVDPVSKLRVSQPSNLIDTDFEYGLQSTKWETLELVKNIPTFFSRNGDESLTVTSLSTINGSDVVTVVTSETHTFLSGSPLIVAGSKNITCDGSFIVTTVLDSNTFQYKAKAIQSFTGSILGDFTQVFAGSLYQGTEFDITGIDAITTDGLSNSKLTVTTVYPTKFELGTSFYLTNSVGQQTTLFNAANVEINNALDTVITTLNNNATGETGFALGGVQPYDYTGTEAIYFINGVDTTVNTGAGIETITFNFPHGMIDNETYLYVPGEGNGAIGGLSPYVGYYVRVLNSTTIYLTTASGSTSRLNLSSTGTNGGVMRSAFIRGYRAVSASTLSSQESITFNRAHGLSSNQNQPVLFFNGTSSSVGTSTNLLNSYTVRYPKTVRSTTSLSFTATPGGTQINLTSTSANGVMIKASLLPDRDTIYFPNHGLQNNDSVLYNVVSGTAIGGLSNGTSYKVEPVGTNRIRFKNISNEALINLTNLGGLTSEYRITAKTALLNNDSISLENHGLPSGASVTYSNSGNTDIGGMVDGTTYYVFEPTINNFKLSTTSEGWAAAVRNLTQNTTSVNISTNIITLSGHSFVTGEAVQYLSSTPIGGLRSGAFYWVRSLSATTFSLHWSKAGAAANTDRVVLGNPRTGTGTFRQSTMVDLTATSTGTHSFSIISNGATDGVYNLVTQIDDRSFEVQSNNQIPVRSVNFTSLTSLSLSDSALYIPGHSFVPNQPVEYSTTGTVVGGLTASTTYYVIRINNNWIKLATSAQNAEDDISITLTSNGTGTHSLSTSSISGEVPGPGTLTIPLDSPRGTGTGTNFTAIYSPGDRFFIFINETTAEITVSSINTTSNVLTTSTAHGLTTENIVRLSASAVPGGLTTGGLYYVRVLSSTTLSLHPTPADADADTNILDITTTGTSVVLNHITSIGETKQKTVEYVNSFSEITFTEPSDLAITDERYSVNTSLLLRADGFAIHRPYDGGVELIPSKNPDSSMIRQTRRYFRYQSGKGIQVSFAVNFSPTTTIDTMTASDTTATITTRFPHRLDPGLDITISGATVTSGQNYWNGSFEVSEVVDDYNFRITLSGVPVDAVAQGLVEYYVNSWSNSKLKCGLFDDQNGLFFEYDGQQLYCVRRSSTLQMSGYASVQFKSGEVLGTNTKFSSQLSEGDKIVIKGQTYRISKIENDTLLYILPNYRGVDATNVIITKTVDTAIPQSDWNLDICDGTGPTGFFLDIHKIQMAYMDYSWYGAGKVRFGFKDQRGTVRYVHEFVHNNKFTEAYMRSGNIPARYEIENIGTPTYVPALAHWGTSVIMDGRFDDDRSYVFTASSITLGITSNSTISVSGRVESTNSYQVFQNGNFRTVGPAIRIATPSASFNTIPSSVAVEGTGLAANTLTNNPLDGIITPRQPYLAAVDSRIGFSNSTRQNRSLLLLNRNPTTIAGTDSSYTVTLAAAETSVVYEQPLISIRLAPSVDNGTPGALGQREIINRMQLILDTVAVLTTHSCEVLLKLNGALNNFNWRRVTNPSLSQLIYHDTTDTITGGTVVYTFRAQGGSGTTGRTPVSTAFTLEEIATLGNSILGGNSIYPDGPDVLTVVVKLIEDPSTVSTANPFSVSSRISWSESQA